MVHMVLPTSRAIREPVNMNTARQITEGTSITSRMPTVWGRRPMATTTLFLISWPKETR